MGNTYTAEDVDGADDVGGVIAAVQEEIATLKVWNVWYFLLL